jgi:hypothetical protein
MTRRQLLSWVYTVIVIYLIAIAAGMLIRLLRPREGDLTYSTYKDLLPFMIAIPAAWLGYCFQRRSSYLQALRTLYVELVCAVNKAIEHTRWRTSPSEDDFRETIELLSIAIDSVRGVFKNVPSRNYPLGLYPYENLKEIRRIIGWLGFEEQWSKEKDSAHECIVKLWVEMHSALLQEFDTAIPILPISKYLGTGTRIADKLTSGEPLTKVDYEGTDKARDELLSSFQKPWWRFWP